MPGVPILMRTILIFFFGLALCLQAGTFTVLAADADTANAITRGNGKLTGIVADSISGKVIELANVALYDAPSGKLVDGVLADEEGKFAFTHIAQGTYRLVVSFINYRSRTIRDIIIDKGAVQDMGVLSISAVPGMLKEVTVTGSRQQIEDKVDKLVYHADADLSSKGGDAADVLKKVPMVTVDPTGNVSLQGSSNVRVFINNRPSAMMAVSVADALRQIPADQIKTVEVITSPSAKYDAEGGGGIINIITKKNTLEGLHLDIDNAIGNRNSSLGLSGALRKGSTGLNLSANNRLVYRHLETDQEQLTYRSLGLPAYSKQHEDNHTGGPMGQYALEPDHDLSKNASLTLSADMALQDINEKQVFSTMLQKSDTARPASMRDVNMNWKSVTYDVSADYLHSFPTKRDDVQHELSISAQHSGGTFLNNFDASNKDAGELLTGRQRNHNTNTFKLYIFKIDQQIAITKDQQLEFGVKDSWRQVDTRSHYYAATPGSEFTEDTKRPETSLHHIQNVAGGYAMYTISTASKLTVKAGLRYEYTTIDAGTSKGGAINIPSYGTWVPTLNVSQKIGGSSTIKLGYNRRIERPDISDMNPNINTVNPYYVETGNPYLKPEVVSKIELGYSGKVKKVSVNVSLYTKLNRNRILELLSASDTLAGGIMSRMENLGKDNVFGTNLYASVDITKRLSVSANADIVYRNVQTVVTDLTGQSVPYRGEGMRYNAKADMRWRIRETWAASANFGYTTRSYRVLGYENPYVQYSIGVRKTFANKRGSVSIAAENFLTKATRYSMVLTTPQLKQDYSIKIYNSNVRLTFSYKIGSLKDAKLKKGKRGSGDEE